MENAKKASFVEQVASLPKNFWVACFMEILERLAFFGSRAVAPLFLVASAGKNGLGLSYSEKGVIYTVWALLQCLIPMVSGGYTERYGYRKSLAVAFILNVVGYTGMALSRPLADQLAAHGWEGAGFWVFMLAACFVATGTAIFKPPAHGTIAKGTTEETSSMGWGIFYWVVNIGGALAPMCAAKLRGEINWHYVFYGAAIVTAANFLPAFLLYKEPEKVAAPAGEKQPKGPFGVFAHSILTIFKDLRLVVFLGIFSCFWLMFMQLWDLLPNFVDEWVNSGDVAPYFKWISDSWVLGSGMVKPEIIINIDSLAIIALVIFISWLISKISKLAAMILGMLISLVGFCASGSTTLGWFCCLAVFVFAIGEMMCSPTFSAYVGLIAPPDKKALYMGYSNIPFAIGWALGNLIGGFVYEGTGARANLALEYLANRTEVLASAAQAADWSGSLEKVPVLLKIDRSQALPLAAAHLGLDPQAAAAALRQAFRYDRGQIDNLAFLCLATCKDKCERTDMNLAKTLIEKKDWAGLARLAAALAGDEKEPLEAVLANYTHLLPQATDSKRSQVFGAVRDLVNKGLSEDERKDDSAIADFLWAQYGSNPEVTVNLAVEYLAQSSDVVRQAVAEMTFESPPAQIKKRLTEIEERTGMDASKSFPALSSAMGLQDADVEKVLSLVKVTTDGPYDRLYAYLINQPARRFAAVAERDWISDKGFLREIIRPDEKAVQVARDGLAHPGAFDASINWLGSLFTGGTGTGKLTEEGIDYGELAQQPDLIQKALAVKDWSGCAEQAERLLRLNPAEARALIAAQEQHAAQVLWDEYHPYVVWYYLGAIGLLGTIGMVVFYFATKERTKAAPA